MATSPSRTLKLTYLGDASQLGKSTKQAGDDVKTLGDRAKNVGKVLGTAFLAVGAAGVAMGKKLFDAFEQVSTANARIEAVVDSMGNFEGQIADVTDRLVKQAEATARLTGIDRNLIKESQALLLTFDSVNKTAGEAGGVFDRATQAAVDLSAAGFGSVTGTATQLGKALEDPIKGLASLGRSGVTFTEEQKELIKVLVESNQTFEAQDIILKAIEKQVGGVAEATATGSARISQSFGILFETIAQKLAPEFEKLVALGLRFVEKFAEWWQINGDDVIAKFRDLAKRVADTVTALKDFSVELLTAFRESVDEGREQASAFEGSMRTLGDTIKEIFGKDGDAERDFNAFRLIVSSTTVFVIEGLNAIAAATNFVITSFRLLPDNLRRVADDLRPIFQFIIADVNLTIDAVNRFLDTLNRLPKVNIPQIPSIAQPAAPAPAGPAQNITVNVTGAIDPEGTARTIERVLADQVLRSGRTPSDIRALLR
jgi:hypothetical protein